MFWSSSSNGVVAANRDAILMRDRDNLVANATPVIYCHHATGTARTPLPSAAFSAGTVTDKSLAVMAERLTVLGHPVAASDQVSPTSWGVDAAQAEVTQLLIMLNQKFGTNPNRVLLLGDSMGTVLALNWARANPTKVAAIALLLPIPDLAYAHSDPQGNVLSTAINTAYGSLAAYQAAEPTHNPSRFPAAYKDMHIRFFSCSDDPVGSAQEVNDFVAEVQAQGGSGSIAHQSMGAHGHTIDVSFDTNLVTDFLHTRA